MQTFEYASEFDHSVEDVFAWHLRPGAFERLVPPWQSVRVVERSGEISDGGTVTLALRFGPAPVRWTLRHTGFEANRLIRDEQVSGPFSRWIHEHRFQPMEGGRCRLEDHVEWDPPLGGVGDTMSERAVRSQLERLFRFRHLRLRNDLARHHSLEDGRRLTVAITGSGGFIGSQLTWMLRSGGHRVIRLIRGREPAGSDEVRWNPKRAELDPADLEGVDAAVHLAGEPIAGIRWTSEKKRAIRESRERGTLLLARTLAGLSRRPAAFVSASGVHYYGSRGSEVLTEESPAGDGFLAEVCRVWERAAVPASEGGIRTVRLRTGMVLSPAGGALGTMLLPFRVGVGGRLGSGHQFMSWIDLDDHLGLILHALRDDRLEGGVNATAPNPVPNAGFTSVLGRVLGRPTLIPLPTLAVKGLLGEMGRELLLVSQRAVPRRAQSAGFRFFSEGVEDSLRFQLGRMEE